MENDVLVMIPGPTPVVPSIQQQMGREIQAFGDPRFVKDYKDLIDELGTLFNCSGQAFPLAGTGTLAMEMAIANTTKRGDNILIVSNGFFGDRFIDIAQRKGLNADVLQAEWGTAVSPEEIDKKLSEKDYAAMTVTHVDTSTAALAPVAQIGDIMKKYPNTLYILDGVAATGGEFADVNGMGIDVMFTGSQKAFGVCPGMFVLWANEKALARRKSLGTIPEYYVDFEKWLPIMENPAKYFATPAVNLVWAMKEATALIRSEGLAARGARHTGTSKAIHKALEALGFSILAKPDCRAGTLSVCIYPDGVDDAKFRAAMFDNGVIVAGALGAYAGKAFRLGHMGNIDNDTVIRALNAVELALNECGKPAKLGVAARVFEQSK